MFSCFSKNYFLMFWAILMFIVLVKIISGCFWVILMFRGLVKIISECFRLY